MADVLSSWSPRYFCALGLAIIRGARGLASRLRCEKITHVARVAPLVPPTLYLFARLPSGVKLLR